MGALSATPWHAVADDRPVFAIDWTANHEYATITAGVLDADGICAYGSGALDHATDA